ncbi:hypothetical protein BJP39_09940 [Streptomyces sp. CC77]|nr:hypothetical protein BJP39_09940 [Streptomyces sp. CC77]
MQDLCELILVVGSWLVTDSEPMREVSVGQAVSEKTSKLKSELDAGQAAADRLAKALKDAGFTLPSLSGTYPVQGTPMVASVALGRT